METNAMEKEQMLEMKEQMIDNKAERYAEKYSAQLELLESSPLGKVRSITSYDMYALGEQLNAFDNYVAICEEDGSVNQLGKIPNIAHDVITVVYGTSVMPLLASIQPIEEESGMVYYRNVKASSTRGNVTAGDTITSPLSNKKTLHGYASNVVNNEAANSVDLTTEYSITLASNPIRRQSVKVVLTTGAVWGKDDGNGVILGVGVHGTVNYTTGVVALNFAANPGAHTGGIKISYQTNFEAAEQIPTITSFWATKQIFAKIYALRGTIGMLQSFGMRKRFGVMGEEELAKDLVGEINAEIGGDLIRGIVSNATGNTNWNKRTPTGVSYYEHQMTVRNAMAQAEAVILGNAGRGTVSAMVAGVNACAILETLPGFTKVTDGRVVGPHLFGTFNGASVIRVTESAVCGADVMYPLWRGTSPFEAAAVYCPFMPLAVTTTLPTQNPLMNQRAAAVWAGLDVIVPQFITKVTVTDEDYSNP